MTDEDESTDSGIIAAERAILKFLRGREANDAAQEDRGTSTVNQLAQHLAPANPVKTNEDHRRIGGNDPPRLEPARGMSEAGRQGDRLRSQPMEFSADFWRRRRPRSQQNRSAEFL